MEAIPYGRLDDGTEILCFSLASAGLRARILTYGAVIAALETPDAQGDWANVVLGLDSLEGYVHRSPHFGAVPGRFANRIAHGRFTLDGVTYQLTCNDGPNTLHGGPTGFGHRAWTAVSSSAGHVALRYVSQDGEEGYPGTLTTTVTYTAKAGDLRIDYRAETDRPTVLNLTNHSYFNLAGEGSGDVMGHLLQIEADHFTPIDPTGIPTGEVRPVAGTPFDFRIPQPIGACIREADDQLQRARGYDHNWMLRPGPGVHPAARLHHPGSGRTLQVLTDQPGVQAYSGNMLTGALAGPSRRIYRPGDAVCLETQHVPDSPNQPTFPSTVLRPHQVFTSSTVFRFFRGD